MLSPLVGLGSDTFFTGATSSTLPLPRTILLNGRTYALSLKNYAQQSEETLQQLGIITQEPNDHLFSAKGAWARYRYSWYNGAGQRIGDLRDGVNPYRYWTSRGVNPWVDHKLTIQHSTTNVKAISGSGLMVYVNGYLFVADGTTLWRAASGNLASWTAVTGLTGTINNLSTDGVDLYVATTLLVYKVTGTGAGAAVSPAGNFTMAVVCGGRLVAAKGPVLGELTSGPTFTTISTHYQASFNYAIAFAAGSRIYVGGYAGTRTELNSLAVTSAGALAMSTQVASFPDGELLRSASSYAGVVILCTSNGVRMAQVSSDTLTYGPLVNDVGDCSCVASDGRFAWVGWSTMPDGGSGTARLALDTTVAALQPAYAGDVATTTVQGTVGGVARVAGVTVFSVAGSGIFVESATAYETAATIASGSISFGTVEPKGLTSLHLDFNALVAGQTVQAVITDQDGVSLGAATATAVGATSIDIDLSGQRVYEADITITLSSDGTSTPTLRQWRVRGYPIPPPVETLIVPLLLAEEVLVSNGPGQEMSMNIANEVQLIRALFVAKTAVTFQIGNVAYRVRVDQYQLNPSEFDYAGQTLRAELTVKLVIAA